MHMENEKKREMKFPLLVTKTKAEGNELPVWKKGIFFMKTNLYEMQRSVQEIFQQSLRFI